MLANVNKNLIFYFLIALPCVLIALILSFLIFSIIKAKKKGEYTNLKMILSTVASIIIAGASWIFNMGWIRVILTIMLVPFIHAIVFFVTNLYISKYIRSSNKLKLLNVIFFVSYLMSYVLLPDGGDVGGVYVFFWLIHNDVLGYVCAVVCTFAIITHIVVFILQIIQVIKLKREIKSQNDIRDY